MNKRIPTLDEFINESNETGKFIIKTGSGQYLKSFEYGGVSSEWTEYVEEAKTFNSNETAYNVMGYH